MTKTIRVHNYFGQSKRRRVRDDRDPDQSDLNSAARGLGMLGKSIAELEDIVRVHEGNSMFASRVIMMAAKQMIAAKKRMGARDAGPWTLEESNGRYFLLLNGSPVRTQYGSMDKPTANRIVKMLNSDPRYAAQAKKLVDKARDRLTGPTRMQVENFYNTALKSSGSKAQAYAKTIRAFELSKLVVGPDGTVAQFATRPLLDKSRR